MKNLTKKQRIIFNEFWNHPVNSKLLKAAGIKKKDAVAIWRDGMVYGKNGHSWKRKVK